MTTEARPAFVGAADVFALPGRDCITEEQHFGIKGFMLTASVPHRDALSVRGLWAPPFASSDFLLEVRLDGEKVPCEDYLWNGNDCQRRGRLGDLRVDSSLVVPMERRAALLEFTVNNEGATAREVALQLVVQGVVDHVSFWEFSGPGNSEANTPWAERALAWVAEPGEPALLVKRKAAGTLAVATDLPMARWETLCGHWEGAFALGPGETRTIRVALRSWQTTAIRLGKSMVNTTL